MEARRKRLIAAGAMLLGLATPLVSSSVRDRLAGAWRGFANPSGADASRTDTPPASEQAATIEGADLRGDFELVDPLMDTSLLLDGVVPTLSDLPIPLTRRTLRYVSHYATDPKGRETLIARLRRAERYRGYIERSLRDADLPEDLLFLAAIESGFNPQASSPVGAAGLFQFMPETAARFGLLMNSERDERRSIPRSTEAALLYLRFLYDRFGEWDLALAAYNCGEGRMDKAIAEGREKLGRGETAGVAFHELAELQVLPKETRDFVPHIHAFAIVFHNRDLLGFSDLGRDAPQPFAEIAVPPSTRLSTIAKGAGISLSTFRDYNPDLLNDRVPGGKSDALVSVPVDELARTLAALPAFLARDEADKQVAKAMPKRRAGAKAEKPADIRERAQPSGAESSSKAAAKQAAWTAVPGQVGAFLLDNGLLVQFDNTPTSEVEISAKVSLLDPFRNRSPIGEPVTISARSSSKAALRLALDKASADLSSAIFERAAPKLRAHLAAKRAKLFEKTGFGPAFGALSEHVFPKGHPLAGALLVGPTEPADDMFLEPEPTWALDAALTLRGPVDPAQALPDVEAAFAKTFEPAKLPALSPAGSVALGPTNKHLVVGWASQPASAADETALSVAFVLACHNKLGRLHRALRHDRSIAAYVNCALESTPQANVAWVLASPALPYSTADADQLVDKAVDALIADGPTDAELVAAKGLLRSELARELSTATLRGLPKSRVLAHNDAIILRLGGVDRKAVMGAAQKLFDKKRRFSVTSGG